MNVYMYMPQAMAFCDFVDELIQSGSYTPDPESEAAVSHIEDGLKASGGEKFGGHWVYFYWHGERDIWMRLNESEIGRIYSLIDSGIRFFHSRLDTHGEDWRLAHLVRLEEMFRGKLTPVEVEEARARNV